MLKSAAYDEVAHVFRSCLVGKYSYWNSTRPIHWLGGPFCALAPDVPALEKVGTGVIARDEFFAELDFSIDVLLFPLRFLNVALMVILAAVVYRWGKLMAGERCGLLALGLLVFEPNILAHGRLMTTDTFAAVSFTLSLYLYYRVLETRKVWYLIGCGVSLLLAMLGKPTAVVLLLLVGLMTLPRLKDWRSYKPLLIRLSIVLILLLVAIGLYALVSGVDSGLILRPLWLRVRSRVIAAVRGVLSGPDGARGWPAYMLGRRSTQGWLLYFPFLFLLKTPLPLLLGLVWGIFILVRDRKWTLLAAFSMPLWMFIAYTRLALDIGYRHLLPAIPLMVLVTAYGLSRIRYKLRRLVALPVLWMGLASLLTYPHYLTYFNLIAGGPGGGIDFFTDSNLDWGQDLKGLKRWLDEHDVEQIYLSYFGGIDPHSYGIDFLRMETQSGGVYTNGFTPVAPYPGIYAISATNLTGQYFTENPSLFSWFRQREPIVKIGHSIWVYEVLPEPDLPQWAAVCTLPDAPPLQIQEGGEPLDLVDEFRRGVPGVDTIRWITFDCSRGWPLGNTESGPGWLLIPSVDGVAPAFLPGDTPLLSDYRQESYAGDLLYQVFRWDPQAYMPGGEITALLGDVLALESTSVTQDGQMVELTVTWQVLDTPSLPVSFMAHLWDVNGQAVAANDGTTVPPEYWQPGDRFVQVHRFPLPAEVAPGEYRVVTGAYTVPNIELLPVTSPSGDALGDTLVVETLALD